MDNRAEAIDILTRMSTNHFYGHREQEAFKLGAEALKQRWILITDELPKIGDRALVTIPSIGETFVTIGTYAGEYRWYVSDYGFCEKVIAWMPLPEPYKGGDGKC